MKSNKIFISKIVASVLAFVLAVSTAFTAFAAIGTSKGKITVKDLEAGATATAYQIMTVSYDTTADQPKSPEYFWTDSMYTWLQTNETYKTYADNDKSATETFSKLTDAQSKAFFADVAAAIKTGTVTATSKTATNSSTDSAQNVAISDLDMGEYLVLITGGVNIYQPIAVNVVPKYNTGTGEYDMDNPEITNLKNKKPSITKTIPTDDHTVAINDIVSYQLDVTIPSYPTTATAKTFYVNDILSNGLTFNDDILVYGVKADGSVSDALTIDTYYTKSTADRAGNTVTFSLKFDGVQLANAGFTGLKITYSATVNKDIVVSTGNGNTATIEYNNNPYEDDSWKDGSSEQKVYTYGLNLTKVDKTDNTKKLGGAEFKLLTDAEDETTAIYFVKLADGHYRVAVKNPVSGAYEADATDTIVSGTETATLGQLKVDGLDLGVYYLKETKAPAGGYKIPSSVIPLTVKDDDVDGTVDDEDTSDLGYLTMNIENTTGFTLPTTGGMGTVIFTVGGIALVALGAAMIIIISKKSKKEAE